MAQNPIYDMKNHVGGGVSIQPGTALSGTAAVNGDWVDCATLEGPVHGGFAVATASGSPDSYAVACKLQEADTSGGSGSQDLETQSTLSLTANKTRGMVRGTRTKRYVRAVMTPAFTGGSAPAVDAAADVLGQKQRF